MKLVVEAIFENGVLRPLKPLPLSEGHRVLVTIIEPDPNTDYSQVDPDRAAAVRQFLEYARSNSFTSTGPYPTREELWDRDAARKDGR